MDPKIINILHLRAAYGLGLVVLLFSKAPLTLPTFEIFARFKFDEKKFARFLKT